MELTPKQKAKEIFDKMYFVEDPMGKYPMCFDTAKQCALIAVDEILQSHYVLLTGVKTSIYEYWQEVKEELLKIQ